MFKKNDYIVTLEVNIIHSDCGKNNYCFKQRYDSSHICPCCDLIGSNGNANQSLTFEKSENLTNWRYATKQEIEEYDRLGKPYDVTTLKEDMKDCLYDIDEINKLILKL